jgi:hypothetical protein
MMSNEVKAGETLTMIPMGKKRYIRMGFFVRKSSSERLEWHVGGVRLTKAQDIPGPFETDQGEDRWRRVLAASAMAPDISKKLKPKSQHGVMATAMIVSVAKHIPTAIPLRSFHIRHLYVLVLT